MAALKIHSLGTKQWSAFSSVVLIHPPSSSYSTDVNISKHLSGVRRGNGGRSSFSGIVATVFGASGFLGKAVCNKLGKIGSQIIVPYRGDYYDVHPLKLCGDLGQVLYTPFHLKDEESIRKAVRHSNLVINLIGRDWETKNFTFDDVNVKGAQAIARIARECGVERLIHVSSMNVQENPEPLLTHPFMLKKGSKFLATKWKGEQVVRDEFPEAIIFRPADMYGQEDRFLTYYASFMRRQLKGMPLWKKGEATVKQPVYYSDVAQAIINAARDPDVDGQTYQAVGPKRYQLSELVDYLFRIMRKDKDWGYFRYDLRLDPFFAAKVELVSKLPGFPLGNLGWDKLERDHVTDQVDPSLPTLEDLGVVLTHLEDQAPWELKPYRALNYYDEELGEFEKPAPPRVVA